jgi:hypothetical protein
MEAVIQIHGFKSNDNEFILKEFAVVGKTYRTHVLFKSPYPYNTLNSKMQRTARWLTRHYHHLKWDDGDTVYSEELISSLCKPFDVIYTKGTEKAKFLRQFHDNVIEIDESLYVDGNSTVTCMIPSHNKDSVRCALNSAVLYAQRLL